ncbi:DUF1214 domain-containing protein [Streptacidiphilus sp. MAP12-16]|uniref:DUF1214 domain-containing protein n=1 Tax=Streptacidiphilus sp. MAP12-16 TaxID=3156300 RepID=UPI0035177CE6
MFWSVTVHDSDTRCLIDNPQQRGDRGSRDPKLPHNQDGFVDLYLVPLSSTTDSPSAIRVLTYAAMRRLASPPGLPARPGSR